MSVRSCLRLIKSTLLIIALNSCVGEPETVTVLPVLPVLPEYPPITWIDIPDYYSLSESDFDDLQDFFDEYDGYRAKMDYIKSLYGENK